MGTRNVDSDERHFMVLLRERHIRAQGNLCYFCKVPMTPADERPARSTSATLEHFKPVAQGGGTNWLNTAASCNACNTKRSAMHFNGKRDIPIVLIAPKPQPIPVNPVTRRTPKGVKRYLP